MPCRLRLFLAVALVVGTVGALSGSVPAQSAQTAQDVQAGAVPLALSMAAAAQATTTIQPGYRNMEVIGHLGGLVTAVFMDDRYAYFGVGPQLAILDIENLRHPRVIGYGPLITFPIRDIAVMGDVAYLASAASIQVINISDPVNPRWVSQLQFPKYVEGIVVLERYLYAAAGVAGLHVVDISNPQDPSTVGVFDTSGSATSVAVDTADGSFVLVADGTGGLLVVDVSEPRSPRKMATYGPGEGFTGSAQVVTISGATAYVSAVLAPDGRNGVHVFDIRTPTVPRHRDLIRPQRGTIVDVAIEEGIVYMSEVVDSNNQNGGILVAEETNLETVQRVQVQGMPRQVAVRDRVVYLAASNGWRIADLTSPTRPVVTDAVRMPMGGVDLDLKGNRLYVADADHGIAVLDVSDPTAMSQIGILENLGVVPSESWSVEVAEPFAFVGGYELGLMSIDISDPTSPRAGNRAFAAGYGKALAFGGNFAYQASVGDFNGFRIFRIADPYNPSLMDSIATHHKAEDVAIRNNWLYVADTEGGLSAWDISQPLQPIERGRIIPSDTSPKGMIRGVVLDGAHAYVTGYRPSLRIIDVSDPLQMIDVAQVEWGGIIGGSNGRRIAVSNGRAYLADYQLITAFDVRQPQTVEQLGYYAVKGSNDVVADGDIVFANGDTAGIYALRYTPPIPDEAPPTCTTATPLIPATDTPAAISYSDDLGDVFTFDVTQPFAQVDVQVTDPREELDVTVYRDCDTSLGNVPPAKHRAAQFIDGKQRVSFGALAQTGRYYVHVRTAAGWHDYPLRYSLRVDMTPPAPGSQYTLIVANQPRLEAEFKPSASELAAWRGAVEALAKDDHVRGGQVVWEVETQMERDGGGNVVKAAFDAWHDDPLSPVKTNAVALAMRDWIWQTARPNLPDLRYVVLLGDDRMMPQLRVPIVPAGTGGSGTGGAIGGGSGRQIGKDDGWAPEQDYLWGGTISDASGVGSALNGNFTLTDDVFSAPSPAGVPGQDVAVDGLYVPQLAVGRLVESPADMITAIQAFLARGGEVPLSQTFTAGYDFMLDGVQRADKHLAGAGVPDTSRARLLDSTWMPEQFRTLLYGARRDLTFVGMHATHYQLDAPNGAAITATDLQAGNVDVAGGIAYGLACHAGLSVPGDDHGPKGQPLDLPEVWLAKGAAWVGSTGWAYGMDGGFIGYQEELMADFTARLVDGDGATIGTALAAAKAAYYRAHDLDAMHAKTLAGTTLYGLPMLRTRVSGIPRARGDDPAPAFSAPAGAANEPVAQGVMLQRSLRYWFPADQMKAGANGDYFTYSTQRPRADAGEPVQPRLATTLADLRLPDDTSLTARSVVFREASYRDVPDFKPLVLRASLFGARLAQSPPPPTFDAPGWYPWLPVSLRPAPTPAVAAGTTDSESREPAGLVFNLGQFHPGRKVERLYEGVTVDAFYSNNPDHDPPLIERVDGLAASGAMTIELTASDLSGIHGAVVTYTRNDNLWLSRDLVWQPAQQRWTGAVPLDAELLFQVVDKAGNVALDDNHGKLYSLAVLVPDYRPPPGRAYFPIALHDKCENRQGDADIVLVFDLSTSMLQAGPAGRSKLDDTLAAARAFVASMHLAPDTASGGDRVAIVGFNNHAWIEQPLTHDRPLIEAALTDLPRKVMAESRLDLAFQRGSDALADHLRRAGNVPVVILLADGHPSLPGSSNAEAAQAAETAASALRAAGITVYTVGVGRGDDGSLNADLLRRCATRPALYYEQPDASKLGEIYGSIDRTIGCLAGEFWRRR